MIRSIVKEIYYSIISLLPTKAFISVEYFRFMKKFPNLKEPKMFCEKLQCLKLSEELEGYFEYADKYEVRKYVSRVIGEEYLSKLLAVYESFDNIEFESLPNRFILKCTHGSGFNMCCIESRNFNMLNAKRKVDKWMKTDFYKYTRESQYRKIKPRIICEEYLEDKSGNLIDYKVFCFNGKPEFIEVNIDKYAVHYENFYDIHWNSLNIKSKFRAVISKKTKEEIMKPDKLEEMLSLAKKLSENFVFVRVDFYIVDERIIFGELTFVPGSGLEIYIPAKFNYELAKLI